MPAACQGVIGFKPTFGTVSAEGVFPLSPSFDTVGLFARDLPLLTAAFRVISGNGADASPAVSSPAETPRIDLSLLNAADESAAGVRAWASEHLSGSGKATTTSANVDYLTELIERGIDFYDIVRRYEAYVLHKQFLDDQGEQYQPGVWAKILSGQNITEAEYQSNVASLEELRATAESSSTTLTSSSRLPWTVKWLRGMSSDRSLPRNSCATPCLSTFSGGRQ